MSVDQLEIKKIASKWADYRHLSVDEIEEPDWKEAHTRYFEKYGTDMVKLEDIATRLQKMIEPPRAEKKTKGQRKRDIYAKVQAREAARAAKK